MVELARQTQSYVRAYNDPDDVGLSDSRFYTGSRWEENALVPSLRLNVARQIKEFRDRAYSATLSWTGVVEFWSKV